MFQHNYLSQCALLLFINNFTLTTVSNNGPELVYDDQTNTIEPVVKSYSSSSRRLHRDENITQNGVNRQPLNNTKTIPSQNKLNLEQLRTVLTHYTTTIVGSYGPLLDQEVTATNIYDSIELLDAQHYINTIYNTYLNENFNNSTITRNLFEDVDTKANKPYDGENPNKKRNLCDFKKDEQIEYLSKTKLIFPENDILKLNLNFYYSSINQVVTGTKFNFYSYLKQATIIIYQYFNLLNDKRVISNRYRFSQEELKQKINENTPILEKYIYYINLKCSRLKNVYDKDIFNDSKLLKIDLSKENKLFSINYFSNGLKILIEELEEIIEHQTVHKNKSKAVKVIINETINILDLFVVLFTHTIDVIKNNKSLAMLNSNFQGIKADNMKTLNTLQYIKTRYNELLDTNKLKVNTKSLLKNISENFKTENLVCNNIKGSNLDKEKELKYNNQDYTVLYVEFNEFNNEILNFLNNEFNLLEIIKTFKFIRKTQKEIYFYIKESLKILLDNNYEKKMIERQNINDIEFYKDKV